MNQNDQQIYNEQILYRAKNLHNQGRIEHADIQIRAYNPLCGDDLTLYLKIKDEKVCEAKFNGFGCVLSKVSADLLCTFLMGQNLQMINELIYRFVNGFSTTTHKEISIEGMNLFKPVLQFPSRIDCVVLSWTSLLEFLKKNKLE